MPCRHCDGSGRAVTCLECACDVAAPEAGGDGDHCAVAELTPTGRLNDLREMRPRCGTMREIDRAR